MSMRHSSVRTFPIAAAWLAIATFSGSSLIAAPQEPAPISQQLRDTWSALQRKDYESARQAALKITAIDSKNQLALLYLARAYSELGETSKAEEIYKGLVELNPRHSSAYMNLGVLYGRDGRTDEAVANFRKQLEIDPRNRYVLYNLGRAMAIKGQWDEARQFAEGSTGAAPDYVIAWKLLGDAQLKTHRVDEARRSYERVLALPHEPSMENGIAYELADAGYDLDRSWELITAALAKTAHLMCEPEGLADADKCTSQLRQVAYMLDTAGWVLYRQGKLDEAEPYLRSSFAVSPRGVSELHMAIVLAGSGRLKEAVRMVAQARKRPEYESLDVQETIRELAKAAGGDVELNKLLDAAPTTVQVTTVKAVVLVDGSGKVLEVESSASSEPGLLAAAKSATLPALSWPDNSIRSIRTIEFQRTGNEWVPVDSYAGKTLPPLPCGVAIKPLLPSVVTQNQLQPVRSCSGAF
jgi:tetratricopeptide (TPR) repeat protein